MNSYKQLNDEQLIDRLRGGQQDIIDYIMDKYKFLVRKRAKTMFLIGGESDDLIQEGMIGLFKAIRDFREDKDSSFYHFADLCISRQIYNAVEASRRKKHQPLNSYVSLNAQDEESGATLIDMLITMESLNPEQMLIDQESVTDLEKKMEKIFSKMEKEVLNLYLQGLNYHQIAATMNKSSKTIDNALQRIRRKLSEQHIKNKDGNNGSKNRS